MSQAKQSTLSKLAWLRNLIVPIAILAIFVFCLSIFYLYWVPDRQRHLDDRGFRYLKTLSDQIRLTLNTYDKMMDYAVEAGIVTNSKSASAEEVKLNAYLAVVDPNLQAIASDDAKQVVGEDYADPPKVAIQADEGTHFLYLAFHPPEKAENFAVRADFDKLILRLLGSAELSPFDVLLVSRSDGKIIFQQSISGIEVAQIKNLEDPSSDAKGGSTKQIDVGLLSSASRLAEVRIAGALYRLYSQPVVIGFLPAHPEHNAPRDGNGKAATGSAGKNSPPDSQSSQSSGPGTNGAEDTWIVCGLVRADRFRAESQLIPYNYILMVFAVVVLAGAAYPLLKLRLSSPGERLLARDVTIAAIFVCLVTVVLTFVLVDAYYWNGMFGDKADKDMARLADDLNTNFEAEQNKARTLLGSLERAQLPTKTEKGQSASKEPKGKPQLKADVAATGNSDVTLNYSAPKQDSGGPEPCKPNSACRTNVLNDTNTSSWFAGYPNLLFVAWSTEEGKQRIKWTTRKFPTPYIELNEASAPYYSDVRRALDEVDSCRLLKGIGSQYSPTTGQNITVFWQITKADGAREEKCEETPKGKNSTTNLYIASLITQPISLYGAVLPGGYQFAVLTPDGTVVFHSDPTRNLRENFFAEVDNSPTLVSRVRMHARGALSSNYMGHPHRMYVEPMSSGNQNGPWSIVIFRDSNLEETMNLEIVSLVSIVFSFYALAIVLVVLIVYWLRKDKPVRTWFWPDSRNAQRYRQLVVANLGAGILVLLLARYLQGWAVLACASLIPAAVLLLNIFVLGDQHEEDDSAATAIDDPMSKRCQAAYFATCVSLLIVICMAPCLCYFKVACNFEQKLFVQHQQLMLAAGLQKRDAEFAALYRSTYLGDYRQDVLTRPEDQAKVTDTKRNPIYSYHESLDTSVCPSRQKSQGSPEVPKREFPECDKLQEVVEGDQFLVHISFPYSERFADERHLAESLVGDGSSGAESDSPIWHWTLGTSTDGKVLQLVVNDANKNSTKIASVWTPFQLPWGHISWWVWLVALLILLFWFVRSSLKRIFLLDLITPPPMAEPQFTPARLISDLPVDLLIIGPESREPIADLINRPDVQSFEAEELLLPPSVPSEASSAQSGTAAKPTVPAEDPIAKKVEVGRPVILRHFERLPDNEASVATAYAALLRLQSIANASVIIVTSVDPQSVEAIESSERWRMLLRTYVRIDLGWHSGRRKDEKEEEYQERLSAESYYHWLISGMSRYDKLVLLQLAQERVVNPASSEIVYQLMEQGMIARRFGLLEVTDEGFATVLRHSIPRDTIHHWEKDLAEKKQFSLQTIMAVVGLAIIGFFAYTQAEIFNTWVTYAAGVATTLPKIVQFIDNFRPGKAKS
jgi:hypothetical protein